MKRFSLLLALLGMFLASPALALDLQTARNSGLVGEKTDGYIGAIQNSPDVTSLVSSVNAQRKQEYTRISQQNGQPVDVVAKLAAEEIIKKLGTGSFYQAADGSWARR